MQQEDPFSGRSSELTGARLPDAGGQAAVLDGHRQRLRALDQLVEAARQCSIATDKDLDIVRLAEDEVSLLEGAGGEWAALGTAIRTFRRHLPVIPFEAFGFSSDDEDPFEADKLAHLTLFRDWIERARRDPRAEALAPVDDDEL